MRVEVLHGGGGIAGCIKDLHTNGGDLLEMVDGKNVANDCLLPLRFPSETKEIKVEDLVFNATLQNLGSNGSQTVPFSWEEARLLVCEENDVSYLVAGSTLRVQGSANSRDLPRKQPTNTVDLSERLGFKITTCEALVLAPLKTEEVGVKMQGGGKPSVMGAPDRGKRYSTIREGMPILPNSIGNSKQPFVRGTHLLDNASRRLNVTLSSRVKVKVCQILLAREGLQLFPEQDGVCLILPDGKA